MQGAAAVGLQATACELKHADLSAQLLDLALQVCDGLALAFPLGQAEWG